MKRPWSKEFCPAYCINNTIVEFKNIFIFKPYIKIILESWRHFQLKRDILFYAFTIMPRHLHYIIQPTNETYGIVEMQKDFKKFTAKRILDGLNYELKNGPFHTINIFKSINITRESASDLLKLFRLMGKYSRQEHKVWMPEEKPIIIESNEFMNQKINYIHLNPVKANISNSQEEYPFSSERNYFHDDDNLFKITKVQL